MRLDLWINSECAAFALFSLVFCFPLSSSSSVSFGVFLFNRFIYFSGGAFALWSRPCVIVFTSRQKRLHTPKCGTCVLRPENMPDKLLVVLLTLIVCFLLLASFVGLPLLFFFCCFFFFPISFSSIFRGDKWQRCGRRCRAHINRTKTPYSYTHRTYENTPLMFYWYDEKHLIFMVCLSFCRMCATLSLHTIRPSFLCGFRSFSSSHSFHFRFFSALFLGICAQRDALNVFCCAIFWIMWTTCNVVDGWRCVARDTRAAIHTHTRTHCVCVLFSALIFSHISHTPRGPWWLTHRTT